MLVYKTETTDGRILMGEIHGSGGTLKTDSDVRRLMKFRRIEEDEGSPGVLPEHQGNVSVWTDPENMDCSQRMTKVKASQVARVTRGSTVVFEAQQSGSLGAT